jgi:hypothetical protein
LTNGIICHYEGKNLSCSFTACMHSLAIFPALGTTPVPL